MPAVIYARLSDRPKDALDKSESLDAQAEACRAWAARNGYAVRSEWADKALSGADADRPALWGAINALQRGDVLVALNQSRLARSMYLAGLIEEEVRTRRAQVATVADGIFSDDPDAMLRRLMEQFMDVAERVRTARRTRDAMRRHQAQGRAMGGNPPFGYRKDGERLVEDEHERAVIVAVRKLDADGWSHTAIARTFEAQGWTGRGGTPLTAAKVGRILKATKGGQE
jgi:site-specific DNA recombinase